jgi:hypothetical protein
VRESSNEGSACDRAEAASGSERLRCEALSVKRAVSAPATAQPQWPMACAHQASGLAHQLVAGPPAVCPDRPGPGPATQWDADDAFRGPACEWQLFNPAGDRPVPGCDLRSVHGVRCPLIPPTTTVR